MLFYVNSHKIYHLCFLLERWTLWKFESELSSFWILCNGRLVVRAFVFQIQIGQIDQNPVVHIAPENTLMLSDQPSTSIFDDDIIIIWWWRWGNLIRLVCIIDNLPGQSPTPLYTYWPGNQHCQCCYCRKEVLIGTPQGGGDKNLLAPPWGCQ